MFILLTLPICLLAIVLLVAVAFADVALRDRCGAKQARIARAATPVFAPSAMHACDSVRVMSY